MLRIRDPKVSLDFYTRVMGMRLLAKFDFPEAKVHGTELGGGCWVVEWSRSLNPLGLHWIER